MFRGDCGLGLIHRRTAKASASAGALFCFVKALASRRSSLRTQLKAHIITRCVWHSWRISILKAVTRLEVKAGTTGPLGPRDVVAKAERSKSLTAMLLGAPQSGPQPTDSVKPEPSGILELVHAAPEPTDGAMPDPLLQGLVDRLPKPDSIWSLDDRGKWLRVAAVIFTLVRRRRPR
jgi:hypothetical protein